MIKNEATPIGVTDTERSIEHIRGIYSQSLNLYIKLFRTYVQIKKSSLESSQKRLFLKTDSLFYDEEEKINWDNVRQLMPPNFEEFIKKKYRMLHDKEIRLCCLFALNISPKTIAAIMLYQEDSIPSLKHLIKIKSGILSFTDLLREIMLINLQNANR